MFLKSECRYYAPCGLCTYHNKPCNDVCNKKEKPTPYLGNVDKHRDVKIKKIDGNVNNTINGK